jgi:hypothetical protein
MHTRSWKAPSVALGIVLASGACAACLCFLYASLTRGDDKAIKECYAWEGSAFVKARSYILKVLAFLEQQPCATDQEFSEFVLSKEATEEFFDGRGFYKRYKVFVCKDKIAWAEAIRTQRHDALVYVLFQERCGPDTKDLFLSCSTARVSAKSIPKKTSFVSLW